MAENTVLSASVLPTNANMDHTFAFTAVLSLDSTMLAGGQAINFDFGDGTSQTAVTSDNGVALAAHQCARTAAVPINAPSQHLDTCLTYKRRC